MNETKIKKYSGYWDIFENCENECKQYRYISDLKRNSPGCYYALIRNKWKDKLFPSRTKIASKWENKNNCIEKAKQYSDFSTFIRQAYDCYLAMKENGWLNDVFKNIPNYSEISYWNNYENCKNESLKYKSITELKRNNTKCYSSIVHNKWENDFFNIEHKEHKEFGWWNVKEHCIKEAKKYKNITELKKQCYSCYASILKHNWKDYCFSIFNERKPNGYWDVKEHCVDEAKRYNNLSDFQKHSYGAYKSSKKNGWKDEIASLYDKSIKYHSYDEKIHSIYVYIFEDEKAFYIGRTNNIKRRHSQHAKDKNDTIYKYCKTKGIKIPNFILLKENLTAIESQYFEDFFLNDYKQNGWTPLNLAVTGVNKGSLGATCKWNHEQCFNEAKKYKTITEFKQENQSAYNACKKNNWLYEFFTPLKEKNGYWNNYENCKKAFNNCKCTKELIHRYGGCYNSIRKNNFNDLKY